PVIAFATPVVHANVGLTTGEICLDLLRNPSQSGADGGGGGGSESAWTPTYTILECVRAIRALLAVPEPESPLNVDAAALLRGGDALGGRAVVELWIIAEGGRYEGR